MQNPEENQPLTQPAPQQTEVNVNENDEGSKSKIKKGKALYKQKSMAEQAKEKMSPEKIDDASNYSSSCCGFVFAILIGVFVFNPNYYSNQCNAQVLIWAKLTFYCLAASTIIGILSTSMSCSVKQIRGSPIQGFYYFLSLFKYGLVIWSFINLIALLTYWDKIKTCDTLGTILYIYLILCLIALGFLVLGFCCCCCFCCCVVAGASAQSHSSSNEQHIQFSSEQNKIEL